jgi:hypothetical protein
VKQMKSANEEDILNFPVDNIEAAVDQLTGLGVRFEHYDEPMKQTQRVFTAEFRVHT